MMRRKVKKNVNKMQMLHINKEAIKNTSNKIYNQL